jgi:hypothetical protein
MRCVDEIRGDGVAPIPVTDGAPTLTASDSRTLSASLPQSELLRVNTCLQGNWNLFEGQHCSNRAAAAHQSKNAREFEGGTLKGFRARSAPSFFLVYQ